LLLQRLSQKALDRFDSPQWVDFDHGDRGDARGGEQPVSLRHCRRDNRQQRPFATRSWLKKPKLLV
jgi:hypothetical protein